METQICAVCKQPIDTVLVVQTALGPVHPGHCLNFATDVPISESGQEQLNEVELLL